MSKIGLFVGKRDVDKCKKMWIVIFVISFLEGNVDKLIRI